MRSVLQLYFVLLETAFCVTVTLGLVTPDVLECSTSLIGLLEVSFILLIISTPVFFFANRWMGAAALFTWLTAVCLGLVHPF